MKGKKLMAVCVGALLTLASCGGSKSQNSEAKVDAAPDVLVAYFSATGTTRAAAEKIANIIGTSAKLYEIKPEVPYTDADLDWRDSTSRSSVEMHNRSIRPALADTVADIQKYSVVFLGYPNWWNTAPTIINTFIESNDLKGKTVIPFMTSGGSNILNSEKELGEAYPGIKWKKGLLMNNVSDEEVKAWIDGELKNW